MKNRMVPLAILTACLFAQNKSWAECDPTELFKLATEKIYETSVWFSLDRHRGFEETCRSHPHYNSYQSLRAQLESFVGNHAVALSYMEYVDAGRELPQDSFRNFPSPVASVPAVEYVVEKARDHRIVMVNERHHASSDRLLTMDLLAPLAELGFRHLAIEAGWNGDPINTRGYPITETGYYVNEVVFAEVVRSALELGYRIIPYEFHEYEINEEQRIAAAEQAGAINHQEERDWWQAKNIAARVFDIDSDAKLLVHAGYAHIQESRTDTWAPMAHFLRELTGLDPLTIDQTVYSERSRPELEHPLRRRAGEMGLLGGEAIVLVDAEGQPIRSRETVDFAVFGATTRHDADGRPTWMGMGGRRRPVAYDTPECAERVCIVEARRAGFADEVPLDRVEVASAGRTTLYLPPDGEIAVRVMGLDQSVLATGSLRVPQP